MIGLRCAPQLAALIASCVAGGASPPAPDPADRPAAPAPNDPAASPTPVRETPACAAERAATLAAMQESRSAAACVSAADCAVVTGPGHPDREFAEVVAARDAQLIEARARAHLDTCGAFHVHPAIDAVRVIEARCDAGRCVAGATTLHLDEGDG